MSSHLSCIADLSATSAINAPEQTHGNEPAERGKMSATRYHTRKLATPQPPPLSTSRGKAPRTQPAWPRLLTHLPHCSLRMHSSYYTLACFATVRRNKRPETMEIITKRPRERRGNAADGEPLPQLLDSPLPTPRRSCASADVPGSSLRCAASPLRTQVPFSWESSPGVPKSGRDTREETMPPPKLPPGRWPPQCPTRTNWCYGNGSEASSDDCDASSFSDALDRTSSSPARIGSFDRVTSKRFEDIFLGRAESFAKDRSHSSRHAPTGEPSAVVAASSSSARHTKHWRRRGSSRPHDDDDGEWPKSNDPVKVMPRVEQMSPRACGLMVFFPWSAKRAACGFKSPSTTRHSVAVDHSPSRGRSNPTLRDALQEDNKTDDMDVQDPPPQPRGEKRSRAEWQGRGWGVSSLLDTSKRYCTDARKALSKLSIGLGADSGSARVGRERRSGTQDATSTTTTAPVVGAKLTKLKSNRN
ncbi:uncharacterized protein LOC119272252 [Triticum dicoccoides]|uniref:uncharacterized protein LOC119272252 n=1 Tax=Triticum dicoccoides TaxID=85692 RepID=UPI00188DDCF3|nr:uncharacterized protein LOC119272252 [Triticum dicoccoides]